MNNERQTPHDDLEGKVHAIKLGLRRAVHGPLLAEMVDEMAQALHDQEADLVTLSDGIRAAPRVSGHIMSDEPEDVRALQAAQEVASYYPPAE